MAHKMIAVSAGLTAVAGVFADKDIVKIRLFTYGCLLMLMAIYLLIDDRLTRRKP